jgi:hypothetical protein
VFFGNIQIYYFNPEHLMYRLLVDKLRRFGETLVENYTLNADGHNPNIYSDQTNEKLSSFYALSAHPLTYNLLGGIATATVIFLTCSSIPSALFMILGYVLFQKEVSQVTAACLNVSLIIMVSIPKFAKDAYDYTAKLCMKLIASFRSSDTQNPQETQVPLNAQQPSSQLTQHQDPLTPPQHTRILDQPSANNRPAQSNTASSPGPVLH